MSFLLYGAYGYTGQLIARMAAAQGLKPVLAGRRAEPLAALAETLDLPYKAVDLTDAAGLAAALADQPLVLHCAGPFVHTAPPMVAACLHTGTHYIDITGEMAVFETLAAQDAAAQAAGVLLLPGAGFDVVPTDCMAAHLKRRLPSATHLELAFQTRGGVSHGTATTAVENLGRGGAVRRDGRIVPVPAAWKTREIDFGRGLRTCTSIPWGDVSTAYHSTGIPNIVVYLAMPAAQRRMLVASRYLGPLLSTGPAQAFLKKQIDQRPAGPDASAREQGYTRVWGQVTDAEGRQATALQDGPEGYTYTALAALEIAGRILNGDAPLGFQTPAKAYGPDLALAVPGVTRKDVD